MPIDLESLRSAFEETYSRRPEIVSTAPGRVNLIGEHTDYNEGLVLPCAIDRYVCAAAAVRDDGLIRAKSLDYDQCDEFRVDSVRRFPGSRGWRDYVRGVAWALQDEQLAVRGADLVIAGDLPQGAGLSSSAALEVAVAGALSRVSAIEIDRKRLALICQKAEHRFVGVNCGIMDQFASALGIEGHALLIDCRELSVEPVALPKGISIVILDSKVERKLSDTAYNRRREECDEAASALGVGSLRAATPESLEIAKMDPVLVRRARHVITENGRVTAMAVALGVGDQAAIGVLMTESHKSLRDDFEVSTPQLDALVEIAARMPGVIGARMTGAGFGGCTVNLVERDAVAGFAEAVVADYEGATGLRADVHVCRASDGLRVTDA